MKLSPTAVWRSFTWPGPGSPTTTSSACITSGPPVLWMRMARLMGVFSWFLFSRDGVSGLRGETVAPGLNEGADGRHHVGQTQNRGGRPGHHRHRGHRGGASQERWHVHDAREPAEKADERE